MTEEITPEQLAASYRDQAFYSLLMARLAGGMSPAALRDETEQCISAYEVLMSKTGQDMAQDMAEAMMPHLEPVMSEVAMRTALREALADD
jgi:ADP-ribosylglycohydrolase